MEGASDDSPPRNENELQLEEVGTVDKVVFSSRCFVFAQSWPSWSFTLRSMGCSDLVTAVEWGCAISRKEFEATELKDSLSGIAGAKTKLKEVERPLVFVQGSKSFIGKIIQDIGAHPCGLICAVVPKEKTARLRSFGGLSWRELSHKQVCGATTGLWNIGSNCTIKKKLFWTSSVSRNLGHSLSNVESGQTVTSTKPAAFYKSLPVFRSRDRLPPRVKSVAVEFGSVFKHDQLVLRKITDREMMEVYDLEIPTQKALQAFWAAEGVTASRAFCSAAPAKLLRSAARAALLVSGSVTILDLGVDNRKEKPDLTTKAAGVRFDPAEVPRFGYEADPAAANGSGTAKPDVKAVKSDDAKVDSSQWDLWCVNHFDAENLSKPPLVCIPGSYSDAKHGRLFSALRGWMHRIYRRRVVRGLLRHLNIEYDGETRMVEEEVELQCGGETVVRKYRVSGWTRRVGKVKRTRKRKHGVKAANDELRKDLKAGLDCVERAARSDWWNWSDGSRIMFWRWPRRYRKAVRDGTPLFIHPNLLPNYWKRQSWPSDADQRSKLKDKVSIPRGRRYITRGYVKSLTGFFAVPKGDNDIRIVYDASKCGLNDALWCPNFFLPTIDSVLRNASADTWFGDIDLGEMFLNFQLDEKILPWVGVDVSELEGLPPQSIIERW